MEAFVFCINNKPVGGDHQHVPAATVFFTFIFIMPTTPVLQQHC